MIYKDPAAAAATLHGGSFSAIGQPILERSLRLMQSAYRPAKMSAKGWDFVKAMRIAVGRKEFANMTVKEGVHWTNDLYPK